MTSFTRNRDGSTAVWSTKKKTFVRKTKKPIESGRALERTRATELMVPVPRPACVMTEMPVESIRSPKKKMSARINMVPVVLNLRPAARDGRKRRRGAAVARRLLRRSSGVVGLTRKSNFIRKDRTGRFSGNAFDRAESLARSS